MYKYKGKVIRVVDGDTFDAIVDLGFDISTKRRFRLKDVDTPETWRPSCNAEKLHGEQATKFVKALLEHKSVILTSVKAAVYSRWEAYVELPDGRDLGELIVEADLVKRDFYEDK